MPIGIGYTTKPASQRLHTRIISTERVGTCVFFLSFFIGYGRRQIICYSPLTLLLFRGRNHGLAIDPEVEKNSCIPPTNVPTIGSVHQTGSCAFPEVQQFLGFSFAYGLFILTSCINKIKFDFFFLDVRNWAYDQAPDWPQL